jgi:hypothetical protein
LPHPSTQHRLPGAPRPPPHGCRYNHLTGTLPPELGNAWPSLTVLDLQQNRFSGKVPATWANLTSLIDLSIDEAMTPLPQALADQLDANGRLNLV